MGAAGHRLRSTDAGKVTVNRGSAAGARPITNSAESSRRMTAASIRGVTRSAGGRYDTTTAVPLTVTISMLPLLPTVS